jgi:hypothetical protein
MISSVRIEKGVRLMFPVYNGIVIDEHTTKDETLYAILSDFEMRYPDVMPSTLRFQDVAIELMDEAFRCGWLDGERFGKGYQYMFD